MRTIYVQNNMTISLGRRGEENAVRVIWPEIVERFRACYGEGVFSLSVQRAGDEKPHPAPVSVEGSNLVWLVDAAEAAKPGAGQCDLTYITDNAVAKTQRWGTTVLDSLATDDMAEPPEDEPGKSWYEDLTGKIGNLDNLTTTAKKNLVAAINEAARSGGGGGGGGVAYQIGEGLALDEETMTLSVDTAKAVERDNTKPITSAAVYVEVGNINALLATI